MNENIKWIIIYVLIGIIIVLTGICLNTNSRLQAAIELNKQASEQIDGIGESLDRAETRVNELEASERRKIKIINELAGIQRTEQEIHSRVEAGLEPITESIEDAREYNNQIREILEKYGANQD